MPTILETMRVPNAALTYNFLGYKSYNFEFIFNDKM